jgi:cellulose synthase/poly-beta-1,6-N-acetylglucosamine synthase-like glycosyltransferase/DNA-binding response OmpR family regulator
MESSVGHLTLARPREPAEDAHVLNRRRDSVLVVDPDPLTVRRVERLLGGHGCAVSGAPSAREALAAIDDALPDLVIVQADLDGADGLAVLARLRGGERGEGVSVVVLAEPEAKATVLAAFEAGADDVVLSDADPFELRARLLAKLERRATPRPRLAEEPTTGALTETAFETRLEHESERVTRGGKPGVLAYLSLHEMPAIEAQLGSRARDSVMAQLVDIIVKDGRRLDLVGVSRNHLALLMPGTPAKGAQVRLERLSRKLTQHAFRIGEQDDVKLTPALGYAASEPGLASGVLKDRAWAALCHEAEQLDLHPTRWEPRLSKAAAGERGTLRRLLERARTPLQVAFQQLLCLVLPFCVYLALDRAGLDVTGGVYLAMVVALVLTGAAIWTECILSERPQRPPELAAEPEPAATAIIAAYLPNEADTVLETARAFLAQDYADLQVILAYNTPKPMAVEQELRALAARDPRFEPLRVEGSVSKAQNVNAALSRARGEFVGVFDADHHPAPGSFSRAWRWLSGGADVVQGHCLVRNGRTNLLTRLIATEFEVIYAVTHPGRARLHGFGIFGGSNGYWRTELLRETRMRGFMLTEDIDSSMRIVTAGRRVVSDPGLVSTELAPVTWSALWGQRMRWAQGWSQVSMRHLRAGLRSPHLSLRQRLGLTHLLGWREVYPWLSLQVFPILAYWLVRGEPALSWFVPVFFATTLFTLSVGPAQALAAYRTAHPAIRRNKRWFWLYLAATSLFYTEYKNVMTRTAHIKEAMREKKWKVTPRPVSSPAPSPPSRRGGGEGEERLAWPMPQTGSATSH